MDGNMFIRLMQPLLIIYDTSHPNARYFVWMYYSVV
jgi:hypothetical protein